jgi:predicted PurR-regulated permease PerM
MIDGNPDTTNLLLAIMAAVSVLQAVVLIAAVIFGYRLYRQAMRTVQELEERQIAPLAARVTTLMTNVDAILVDMKDLTGRLTRRTERVDTAIDATMHRVDETAHRIGDSVARGLGTVVAFVQSARGALGTLFNGGGRSGTHG